MHASILDIARQIKLVKGQPAIDLPPAALEMLEWNELDRVYYRVVSASGQDLAGDATLPMPPMRPNDVDALLRRSIQRCERTGRRSGRSCLPGYREPLLVIVAETTDARRAITRKILVATLLTEGLLVVLVLVGIWLVVGRGLAPLGRLREDVARRSDHDLSSIDARPHAGRGASAGRRAQRLIRTPGQRTGIAPSFRRQRRAPVAHTARGAAHAGRAGTARDRSRKHCAARSSRCIKPRAALPI